VPLTPPVLDDRRFADLVAEAKARVPRYAPEWTDLNDSDPGMALVQLFAWMTEATLFRLARVPDLHYVKFLQLLGVELRPAEPARGAVTFPVSPGPAVRTVVVPRGTEVTAAGVDEPIVYETDESLTAVAAGIRRVLTFDGINHVDVTPPAGESGTAFRPFGAAAAAGSAVLLGFGYDPAYTGPDTFPRIQLALTVLSHADAAPAAPVACAAHRPYPSATLAWEYWDLAAWVPLPLDRDDTLALARSGRVLLRTPPEGRWKRDLMGGAPEALFWLRARVATPGYERVPELDAVLVNTVGVTQAQTRRDEVLGGTTGRPNLVLRVALAPVLAGSLVLEVDEGTGPAVWTEVRDFFASGPDDAHFALNRTTGEVRFGSGDAGRVPVLNPTNPDGNVVARVYRSGGGARGNAAAGAIATAPGVLGGIDTAGIRNARPALGGRDEESLADGLRRGPEELKNKDRAVTAEDFESLARHVAGVRRAEARPLAHPGHPGRQVPGAVTVVVVPDGDAPNPSPSDGLLRSVCAYLQPRRLLTCELFVAPPAYRHVRVRADVVAAADADGAVVRAEVERRLLAYLHPLTGGEAGDGWPFGGAVYFSLVYRQVLAVEGVARVEALTVALDGADQPACQDVPLEPGELAWSDLHDVVVTYPGEA